MFNRESRSQPRMQTLIGPTVRVHGDVEFTGGMHVDGHVSGGVRAYGSEESSVSVSVTGIVDGAVVATHVTVDGVVHGDVVATGKVALGPNARVLGNLQYGVIESAAGAQITGTLVAAKAPAKT